MKTRIENLKNRKKKEKKKPARREKIIIPIFIDLKAIPEGKDRGDLLKELHSSTACITMGIFQHAIIVRVRNEKIRRILGEKLFGLKNVRSNENKYIFVTSHKYKVGTLEKIVRGVVNKIKQEQE